MENLKDSKNRGWIRKSSVKRHLRHLPSFFLSISVSGGTNRYVGDFRKEKMKEQCPTVNNLVSGKVYTIGVGVQLRSDTAPPRAIYGCWKESRTTVSSFTRRSEGILSLSEFAGEWKKRMALVDPYDNEFRVSRFDIERTKTIREMVTQFLMIFDEIWSY